MAKIIRCAGNDDVITLKTGDDADTVTFVFESPSKFRWTFLESSGKLYINIVKQEYERLFTSVHVKSTFFAKSDHEWSYVC